MPAQSQHKPLRFLTTKDGLPQSFVSGIVQDKDGFVWIGTRNGLARYDGIHFKQFRHNAGDTGTIRSNVIINMKLDKWNRIWISYESSDIDCFDPVTETVAHVTDDVLFRQHYSELFWLPTADGNLWRYGRENGVNFYDRKHHRFHHFSAAAGHLPDDSVFALAEDSQQQVWIASRLGLSRYHPQTGRFERFLFPDSMRHSQMIVVNIYQRSNGELVLANTQMLLFFNPTNKSFRTVALPQPNPHGALFIQTGPDGAEYFECGGIIYQYSPENKLVPLIQVHDFYNDRLLYFLVDQAGLFWLGLNTAGICQVDVKAPSFEVHPNIRAFQYDLLKQEFGLQLDQFSGWPPADSTFHRSGYFFRSTYDAQHRLWIALRDKVGYYNAPDKKWIVLPAVPGVSNLFPETGLRGIDFAPDGRLWAVSETNFAGYFDAVSEKWVKYVHPADAAAFPGGYSIFTDIKADAKKLWIAGNSGLLRMDIATRRMEVFNQKTRPGMLPTDGLLGMERDPTRPYLLWIGSYEGLICLNKQTLKATVFTTMQGLPDNTIYSIQTDGEGYLWLSTNQGLCRFHPVTHHIRNFKPEDGLPGNEFNRFHHLKLPDGRLGFGGLDGWVLFNPATIQPDTYQPQVAFTGLKIYNEPVDYTPDSKLLPRPLNDLKELILPYDLNTLTFEFAGLEYSQPGKLHYRYRLESYDDKWITTDNPVAGYTKLAPGHYTLHINCTNTTGQWSKHVRTLQIVVLPPWWRTWWAYGFYLLTTAGIGYALYRNWLQRQTAKQQIILQQQEAVQLKAVDEMKSRFFSNITHEFRTPLSLILAPLEQMQKKNLPKELKQELGNVQRNAGQLLQLINQLLDMAKLEASSMKVSLFRGNVETFLEDLSQPFMVVTATKGIQLQVHANASAEEYLFDADKLHTILSNLLSNAVKFTPAGGSIEVGLEQENRSKDKPYFHFQVKDSGIGITAEKLPFIFNRFYQADDSSTRSYGGTGIGLALAKELAELMQGTLTVSSEPGSGTIFTLTLPMAKATDAAVPVYVPATITLQIPHLLPAKTDELPETPEMADKPLVLIVEDNEELNDFITQTFRQQYRVLTAANGEEGLKIANEELPDVIISDWMMPHMDGLHFCQAIKTNLATSHIAFVLLTARAAPVSRIEGLQSKVDDYLTKPFIIEELQLRVANLLEQQRRLREKLCAELSSLPSNKAEPGGASAVINNSFLNRIYAIVEEKLDDTSLGVEEIATGVGMSRANLHRKLKAVAGLTPGNIIRNYRLQRAARYLKEGFNSSETAYKTGFETPAYFTKCFREFYGLTPSEFTRQA